MDVLSKKAKEIIENIIYITIATASATGQSWNTPVYAAHDEHYTFYWASWKENQHSKNIRENKDVFIVIYDSTAPADTGEGVYIKAKAYEITDTQELEHAVRIYYGSAKTSALTIEEFVGNKPRRIYKAIPDTMWMNSDGEIDGNFIDKREEISLIIKNS